MDIALNRKLPAGRRTAVEAFEATRRLIRYISCFGITQVPLALSHKYMATPNLFESVVLNHNVLCTHNKSDRPSDQEVSDRLLSN